MEWENKLKMVLLGNKRHESAECKKDFQQFVLDNIESFDSQCWDMFSNLVDLDLEEMKQDIYFWSNIYQKIKNIDSSDESFGFRSGMRISLIQCICEEKLLLNNEQK